MNTKLNNIQVMLNNYHYRIEEIREQEDIDPLCINEVIELNIELSTGGPADGFKFYLDKQSREPLRGCYYYSDWGWYEEEWLTAKELELVTNYFCIL